MPTADPSAGSEAEGREVVTQLKDSLALLDGNAKSRRRGAAQQDDAMNALNKLVAGTYGLEYLLPLVEGGKKQ